MRTLLVANRGEIARRIFRTADAMGIATVAVHSDADASALHVAEAGAAHALGGNASADTYLRIDKILEAARVTGADAVHPGYGFLSENADFAQAVLDAGLVWVGPPPSAIRQLGSKSAAKAIARSRGVPCLPGYDGDGQTDERLAAEARRIGLPLMVKAAAGGGGRGMRLVTDMAQFAAAAQGARSEALSAFGNGELLLERALMNPRHVEVQVFADAHGHCIHLGERDCSVQRRHQKIIEETPSPAITTELRERMGRCAVELALAAGYQGAGTVEFLVQDGDFFLMEMNTRLQVEHPVTEAVTGLDLVEWQLRIARGEPLPLAQEQVRFDGHAIEVRLCAEDENFTPHAGQVLTFRPPEGVRFDHALHEGLDVPPHYDSMLGKLVVHAPTRAEAIDRLAGALDRLQLLGLPTNRAFLAACLRHPAFRAGQALIPFIAEHGDGIRAALAEAERAVREGCGIAAIYGGGGGGGDNGGDGTMQPGRGLACSYSRPVRLRHRGDLLEATVSGTPSLQRIVAARTGPRRWHAQAGAVDLFIEDASFEAPAGAGGAAAGTELRAPFNGKVIAVKAVPGALVAQGEVLVIIESMKLEHSLCAKRAGVIAGVAVEAGQQVSPGQVLVTLEPLA
ncbi:MAG: ATP-grasp domain-containing protein [Comamonadaceae bacterium]|nr:MAG: ATP-grasp domain-containing protein [Comamonadaceae bacterium]